MSLVPAATEVVCALGLAESLVGVSHECDYPPIVVGKPVVTFSLLTPEPGEDGEVIPLTAGEIDAKVREAMASGESLYRADVELLRELRPDLIIVQGLCDVCAVTHQAVSAVEAALKAEGTQFLDLAPNTLADVLETFRAIGQATGKVTEAEALIAQTQERWDRVAERVKNAPERPRTLLLEWPDPPFSAGHWNSELLALAGGVGGAWEVVGAKSRPLQWAEIAAFAPDVVVLLACGFDAYRAIDEAYALTDAPEWFALPAVKSGECYAADGSAYFNRPGPRLAESAEILATILHPELFTEMLPPYSVQIFSSDLLEPPDEADEATEA